MKLWKTQITIWTDHDPSELDPDVLIEAAMYGDAYCSEIKNTFVDDVNEDPDWDDTDFFNSNDEEEGEVPEEGFHYEETEKNDD